MIVVLQEEAREEEERGKGRPRRPSRGEQEEEGGPPTKKKKGGEEEEGSSISLSDIMKRKKRCMTAREKLCLLGASVRIGGKGDRGRGGKMGDSGEAEDFWFLPYPKSRECKVAQLVAVVT